MNRKISRRGLLSGTGAALALAPFIPITESEAQVGVKKRLITWFTPNGTIYDEWKPSGGELDFQFNRILAPLSAHRDSLLIVDGLEFKGEGPGSAHMKGPHAMFAGSRLLEGDFEGGNDAKAGWGSGISVDQTVANAIGEQTRFSSLVLGVVPAGSNVRHRLSYSGENQPIPPEVDPRALFDRVFSVVTDESKSPEQIRKEKRSVIDLVKEELSALSPSYGSADRIKIDAHLTALRAVERRLELSAAACEAPLLGDKLDPRAKANFPELGQQFMDILATVLACDITRVASMLWSGSTSNQTFPWIGVDDEHHETSHIDTEPEAMEQLVQINTWYSEQFAYFLDKLATIPEGTGSVLDNTLIVWGNELGLGGAHSKTNIPIVLAGQAGGYFKTGRLLERKEELNNRLLVSVLHAMGLEDVETFGNMDDGSGPLPGLTG